MDVKLKAGDIVRLKSGGCNMTIEFLAKDSGNRERAKCAWYNQPTNEVKTFDFTVESLVIIG